MTRLWPEDWRAELARAFEEPESGPTIEVVFVGPDGKPAGHPLVVPAGGGRKEMTQPLG
jgi:hypothetical protein